MKSALLEKAFDTRPFLHLIELNYLTRYSTYNRSHATAKQLEYRKKRLMR